MLMRNLDPRNGHVNGARYIVKAMTHRIIQAELATGAYKGNTILLPRIFFHPTDPSITVRMERKQFPIRYGMAMTANRVQGQTLKKAGIYLKKEFFVHGQLYVAMSRVGSPKNLSIFKPKTNTASDDYMCNVVYKELFSGKTLQSQSEFPMDDSLENLTMDMSSKADLSSQMPMRSNSRNVKAKKTLEEGATFAQTRLYELDFVLSPTQPDTEKDGNCFVWAILDQMMHDSVLKTMDYMGQNPCNEHDVCNAVCQFRRFVCGSLDGLINSGRYEWIMDEDEDADSSGTKPEWIRRMSSDGVYVDQVFIQLTSELLNRKILIVPVLYEDGHNDTGKIEHVPKYPTNEEPLLLLYYSQTSFWCGGHYQSIRLKQIEAESDNHKKPTNRNCPIRKSKKSSWINTENILTKSRRQRKK